MYMKGMEVMVSYAASAGGYVQTLQYFQHYVPELREQNS